MWLFIIVFILSYLYHGFGITVGYHRLLAHRAFKCPLWLEYLIVSGGYLAFEGSPVSWVSTHRVHHRYTDDVGDPHKPADGFWHAYAGWLYKPLVTLSGQQIEQVCPDLYRDPVYRFLDFNHARFHALFCLILCILFRVLIGLWLGPWAVIANILGAFSVFNAPFLVNSVCHMPQFGYKNFATEDGSKNVWWVGLVALGEGWHNNHHAVPQSARHGIKPHEIDLSWMAISLMKALGLASNIRLPKESKAAPVLDSWLAARLRKNAQSQQISALELEAENDLNDVGMPIAVDITAGAIKKVNAIAGVIENPIDQSSLVEENDLLEQLQAARVQLAEQLQAARLLTAQLTNAYDQLQEQIAERRVHLSGQVSSARHQFIDQVGAAREQVSDQILAAREQLVEQLIITCNQLAEQLVAARTDIGKQLTRVRAELSEQLLPLRQESEIA